MNTMRFKVIATIAIFAATGSQLPVQADPATAASDVSTDAIALPGDGSRAGTYPGLPRITPPECVAWVAYDRNAFLPGYLLPTSFGLETCVPFAATATRPPADYAGKDFYVEEFTDEKLRERWQLCMQDSDCQERLDAHVARRKPPHREYALTDPHLLWLLGRIDPESTDLDLGNIRRPGFFARAPYQEVIAGAEKRTFTVEFTVEPEPFERIEQGRSQAVKLRGWYLQGDGIEDGAGGNIRALILMSNGGGGRIVAIEHPSDRLYDLDPRTGFSVLKTYPAGSTGASGQRNWRAFLYQLNEAGFDVLSYDRRGVGVSGGYSDTNTLQQGRDILTVIRSLRDGAGMRVLTPEAEVLTGQEAADALMAGAAAESLPVVLGGSSRGTMSTGWAMTRNFYRSCDYDLPGSPCGSPVGLSNIRAAMMLAGFTSGVGYVTSPTSQDDTDRGLFIAGSAISHHVVFFPNSEILEGIHTWPGLFIGRGLWDYAESLEGSIAAYDRISGLREIVVVRAPHAFETWPEIEHQRVAQRMIAFSTAAVLGHESAPGERTWSNMKELAATASDVWEKSSFPPRTPGPEANDKMPQ